MRNSEADPRSADQASTTTLVDSEFLVDVQTGLNATPKHLNCKYFYDERGSELFDQICELEEYYPTRTELKITEQNAQAIADTLGEGIALLEYGSGSSVKTRVLLDHLDSPVAYLPVDVSEEHLHKTADKLQQDYPTLEIHPIVADFTEFFELPEKLEDVKTCVYFPGSTIGNLVPGKAIELLKNIRRHCAPDGSLIIGFDLQKAREVLELAYDDPQGVTAEFNLNILHRINEELDGDLEIERFRHHSEYNAEKGRIEISVESLAEQTANIGGQEFEFGDGERVLTEYSHKYTLEGFAELASKAGLKSNRVWVDEDKYFALMHLTCS